MKKIYIINPVFVSSADQEVFKLLQAEIENLGFKVSSSLNFVPQTAYDLPNELSMIEITQIKNCDLVLAILSNCPVDVDVAVKLGVAKALGKRMAFYCSVFKASTFENVYLYSLLGLPTKDETFPFVYEKISELKREDKILKLL